MSLYSGKNNYQDEYEYGQGDNDEYGGYANNYGNASGDEDE